MHYINEQARTQTVTAQSLLKSVFPERMGSGAADAAFLTADRKTALGFAGLPYYAPVCGYLMNDPQVSAYLEKHPGNQVLWEKDGRVYRSSGSGEEELPADVGEKVQAICGRVLSSPGKLNEKGELILDLKTCPVGTHFPVNLLLGNRAGYEFPLYTTPKSALDALGRGSFRAAGDRQVLATRCVLPLEENGEPANRQFYLIEDGKQIFYSANVKDNVAEAVCRHSQNRTVITYRTECGLTIRRTIFLLPQEDGMPTAVEAQRVEIENHSGRERNIKIVMTGMFGISNPETIANDVVYANVVVESEVFYEGEKPAALTLHHKPAGCAGEKRFAALLCNGGTLDEFCTSLPEFVGGGTLEKPELAAHLPSRYSRWLTPFFAMGKRFVIAPEETVVVDEFVGMMDTLTPEKDVVGPFDAALHTLLEKYKDPAALSETLQSVEKFWERYPAYLVPDLDDPDFTAYVGHNLPFQTLYQTYVSRAFAWTQKSYRETGFREIQDIYASLYYLCSMGLKELARELISGWVCNVFRMGYAYHDFTFRGKDPGGCSDDALWLVQAVYRYVERTGDADFLLEEFPVAGEDGKRTLWDTMISILTYSGKISVGAHGLPLLDRADWNDTLRLDRKVLKGPEKEEIYFRQLEEKNQPYGVPLENTLSESVMNACLLKIAADEVAKMAELVGKTADGAWAGVLANQVAENIQQHAWKGDFFARCLINDDREGGYTYLGAGGDGLSLDETIDGSYFLNSYSWTILADVATEEQIRIMLGQVNRYLKTDAGLKLCTLVDYDRLGLGTGTALYFPGDRENGGVFKHAAMMAATASLKAAKLVSDESLARELAGLAFFMIGKTLPYKTMENPFILRGNPRFCTQYNNSETGENVGPMLSGTASWLTLAIFEFLGLDVDQKSLSVAPVLPLGKDRMSYTVQFENAELYVEVLGDGVKFRAGEDTEYVLDGQPVSGMIPLPEDGQAHRLTVRL